MIHLIVIVAKSYFAILDSFLLESKIIPCSWISMIRKSNNNLLPFKDILKNAPLNNGEVPELGKVLIFLNYNSVTQQPAWPESNFPHLCQNVLLRIITVCSQLYADPFGGGGSVSE